MTPPVIFIGFTVLALAAAVVYLGRVLGRKQSPAPPPVPVPESSPTFPPLFVAAEPPKEPAESKRKYQWNPIFAACSNYVREKAREARNPDLQVSLDELFQAVVMGFSVPEKPLTQEYVRRQLYYKQGLYLRSEDGKMFSVVHKPVIEDEAQPIPEAVPPPAVEQNVAPQPAMTQAEPSLVEEEEVNENPSDAAFPELTYYGYRVIPELSVPERTRFTGFIEVSERFGVVYGSDPPSAANIRHTHIYGPCHEWKGKMKTTGGRVFVIRGFQFSPRRVAYRLLTGKQPPAASLWGACYNENCVNPLHFHWKDRHGDSYVTHGSPFSKRYVPPVFPVAEVPVSIAQELTDENLPAVTIVAPSEPPQDQPFLDTVFASSVLDKIARCPSKQHLGKMEVTSFKYLKGEYYHPPAGFHHVDEVLLQRLLSQLVKRGDILEPFQHHYCLPKDSKRRPIPSFVPPDMAAK